MQNNNSHHGRQPASQQASPPTDPRTDPRIRRAEERIITGDPAVKGICRDYIWGICQMGAQCKYRHKLDINVMKTVLKFCHDHQNRTGCLRPDCTYLHTSREEEVAFLTTGQVPVMLAERYTALQADVSVQGMPCPSTAGQIMTGPSIPGPSMTGPSMPGPSMPGPSMPGSSMAGPSMAPVLPSNLLYEYFGQPPPPPPPPPPAPAHKSAPQLPIQGTQSILPQMQGPQNMPPPLQGPQNIPAQMQGPHSKPAQMQGPQNKPAQMRGPQNIAQIQGPSNRPAQMQGSQNMPPIMQGPLMPHHVSSMFVPPPPPPPTAATTTMQMPGPVYSAPMPSTSRIMPGMYPSHQLPVLPVFDPTRPPPPLPSTHSLKRTHSDECEAGPSKVRKTESALDNCDVCVQRLLRSNIYLQQVEFQQEQNEQMRAAIARKMEIYESKKTLLRSLTRPESYRRTEEFVENESSMPLSWNPDLVSPPSMPTTSTSFLHQLLEVLFDKPRSEPVQSEDFNSFLQSLVGRTRSNPNGQSTTDTIDVLFDMFTSSPSDRSTVPECRAEDKARNAASLGNCNNGLSRFLGEGEPSPLNASRYAGRPFAESAARAIVENTPPPTRPYADATLVAGVAGPSSRPYVDTTPVPGPSGLAYTEPPPAAYTEAAAGLARFPHAPPPRQYHPSQFEGATVPTTANPPPPYMPGTYSAPAPQPPATRANYYPHFLPPNTMPNSPYANAQIAQAPRPPPSGVQTMPQNGQGYPQFMGRYPNPTHFYPPYQ